MATNVFFNHAVPQEQNLYEDLVVESLRMYGHDVLYLPRTVVQEDDIFNEDVISEFSSYYTVEMYLENVEGTSDAGDLMSKFGVYVQEEATFVISVRTWDRFVAAESNLVTSLRPNEGDLIYFPLSGSMFEIKYVQDDNPFYQVGKLFTFKMRCTLFEYSGEEFETGSDVVDQIELDQGYSVQFTMTNITGAYTYGENITLNGNVVAECIGWTNVNTQSPDTLLLRSLTTSISAGDVLVGETSGASATVQTDPNLLDLDDGTSQNNEFETAGTNYLDFSETNPFGEIG